MTRIRPGRFASSSAWLSAVLLLGGCAGPQPPTDLPSPPAPVTLSQLLPEVVLPRTRLILRGNNLVESASHVLLLRGESARGEIDLELPLWTVSVDRAEAPTDDGFFASLGEGTFSGTATVLSRSEAGETYGSELAVELQLKRRLTPRITAIGNGLVYLNSRVAVEGDGFLLGGAEGQSLVELQGCFLPTGQSGSCPGAGRSVLARVPLRPSSEGDRQRGRFEFAPGIAGPRPGSLQGTLVVVNVQPSGPEQVSGSQPASFQLDQTHLGSLMPVAVSLGQFVELRGAGFVGAPGSTLIEFAGTFTPHQGPAQTINFELVPAYQDGNVLRYVLEEQDGIGKLIDLRTDWGTLSGTWKPTVIWGAEQVPGVSSSLTLKLRPVRQVVWIRFTQSWSEGLRLFGLSAADLLIRRRVLEVMRRDYAGLNLEFREEEPTDFKLYTKVDLAGKDPNGLGLLGYDNTPGKDVDNKRLYDWLGGVNALTQQDGYPGFGGVFLESMLGFSKHPPGGVQKSPLASPLFDQLFDPFRPDQGREVSSAEVLSAPAAESSEGCPATDRLEQIRCAIRILGNVVGSTATHELGHSLGLANPYGGLTDFHNPGDQPNRLMDSGGDRSFEERAELNGQGPAVFCDEEYDYLKKILPLDPPKDPPVTRPGCY